MKKIITLIALHFALLTFAQPGSLDTSFNPTDVGFGKGDSADGDVNTALQQPDGKIIIAGYFKNYNGTSRNEIVRLNTDGSLDFSFNSGAGTGGSSIIKIVLQSDGKIIIIGSFQSYNGISIKSIARLNADGTLDMSFNSGASKDGYIDAIALQPDGKIIIGGYFTNYNGTNRKCIARLNTDGSLDTSFNPGTGTDSYIEALALQPDGKIVVGGDFTTYNGTSRKSIARLNSDGSLDTSFNPGTGMDDYVWYTLIQSDGKIIVGGNFTIYNGTSRNRIARLNSDGSLDTGFNPGTGINGDFWPALIQSDGKVIINGHFTTDATKATIQIIRLNIDGSLDTSFNPNLVSNNGALFRSLQSDGKMIVCIRGHVVRLNTDGSFDPNFNPSTGADRYVGSITLQSNGKIIVRGNFTMYNNTIRNGIARLNADGSLDMGFNPGYGADKSIYATSLQTDSKIIIAGDFTSYNGISRNGIARLNADGSLDMSFSPTTSTKNSIGNTVIQSDGKIIIAGVDYNAMKSIIGRLNVDGSFDTSFNSGEGGDNFISAVLLQPDGKIIISGQFTSFNGVPRNGIARLNADGSLDMSFNPVIDGTVDAVSIQSDGKILIGGTFTSCNGTAKNNIARLNADGSLDISFDPSFDPSLGANKAVVNTLIQSDGKIIIGCVFTNYQKLIIGRLNADGSWDAGFNLGIGSNSYVNMALQPDGKIIIGGGFTDFNGIGRNRIVRLNGDNSLRINDNEFSKSIQLYPNPVSDILTIGIQEEIVPEVEIYDVLGKAVKKITSFDKRVDVSSLPSGVYIINVTDGKNGVYRSKFVKK